LNRSSAHDALSYSLYSVRTLDLSACQGFDLMAATEPLRKKTQSTSGLTAVSENREFASDNESRHPITTILVFDFLASPCTMVENTAEVLAKGKERQPHTSLLSRR
jgi:hypothetical protein